MATIIFIILCSITAVALYRRIKAEVKEDSNLTDEEREQEWLDRQW